MGASGCKDHTGAGISTMAASLSADSGAPAHLIIDATPPVAQLDAKEAFEALTAAQKVYAAHSEHWLIVLDESTLHGICHSSLSVLICR